MHGSDINTAASRMQQNAAYNLLDFDVKKKPVFQAELAA